MTDAEGGSVEPETYDEAAERVHKAFCDPDHEAVSDWDQSMADALRRNGYAIVRATPYPDATERAAQMAEGYAEWLKHTSHRDGLGMGWLAGEELCREIAEQIRAPARRGPPSTSG